ncbi:MAG: SRPBCC family protein [Miltoncostaeaceae bacterium]
MPRDAAFHQVAEFGRASEWDPGLVESRQQGPRRPGRGTVFPIVAEFRGKRTPMTYEITEWEPTTRMVIEGTGEKAFARDEITFRDAPAGGCEITYTAALGMKGALKLAEPFLKGTFNRMGDEAVTGLAKWLSR